MATTSEVRVLILMHVDILGHTFIALVSPHDLTEMQRAWANSLEEEKKANERAVNANDTTNREKKEDS